MVFLFFVFYLLMIHRMSQEENSPPQLPPSQVQEASFILHHVIDPILSRDEARRAKSDDPEWKYVWWSTLGDKNTVQCLLCEKIFKYGIKRQKKHLIGGFPDVSKCLKTTTVIVNEMLKWLNRGKKRNPNIALELMEATLSLLSLPLHIQKRR